ncbi:MAG TPA: hypothetical protein VN428_24740 [Bryobacteraceae bacterium]|nr:hypothetical protein [Bryobacteraceae bacterium]
MSEERDWHLNYFNYFTEVEEQFQRARGTGLFLLSPLDWALIETWKDAGIPLEAVLRGIDEAFEKWREKRSRTQMVNSLAFCAQAVLTHAQQMAAGAPARAAKESSAPFSLDELKAFLEKIAAQVRRHEALAGIADSLERLAAEAEQHYKALEDLDQRLTALEEKMTAVARAACSEEDILADRKEFDLSIRPYRSKLSAEQLAMTQRQFLDRRLLERLELPRLSLFHMR